MPQPRDYDAELKALQEKQRALKARRLRQFGELVVATGADTLTPDMLAGALLAIADERDMVVREGWRAKGEAFFRERSRATPRRAPGKRKSSATPDSGPQPRGGAAGAD